MNEMIFNHFKNIDSAFQYIRGFSIAFLCANVLICMYTLYTAHAGMANAQGKVFVISNGKLLEAVASNRKDKLPVEVRDHIRSFHEYFFNLEPDERLNKKQLARAFYLCDQSARLISNDLVQEGFYAGIVAGNISQHIETDSIQLDMNVSPCYARYYGHLSIVRPTSIVTRTLITECNIRDLNTISDNNPHGFLMEHWRILENKDITSTPR